jgi:phosphate uptake regulator
MVIRSSLATLLFQRYRQKLRYRELREDEFLEKIAKVMNTSVEMLRYTYLAYNDRDDDHLVAMREIHCMFDEIWPNSMTRSNKSPEILLVNNV